MEQIKDVKKVRDLKYGNFEFKDHSYKELCEKMANLYYYDKLAKLTPKAAKELLGKEIEIISFGHAKQNIYDRFVVGKIQEMEGGEYLLLDQDGLNRCITLCSDDEAFWTGDKGRTVYYRDVVNDRSLYEIELNGVLIASSSTLNKINELVSLMNDKKVTILNTATNIRTEFRGGLRLWDFHDKSKK